MLLAPTCPRTSAPTPTCPRTSAPPPINYDLDTLADKVLVEHQGTWSIREGIDPHSLAFQQLCTAPSTPAPPRAVPHGNGANPARRQLVHAPPA